jgi:hypothetical protein
MKLMLLYRLLHRYVRSSSHTGRFKNEWLGRVIFSVSNTIALPVKLLLHYLCHVVVHINVVYVISVVWLKRLRSLSHRAFYKYRLVKLVTLVAGEKAKVISECNWNLCDALRMLIALWNCFIHTMVFVLMSQRVWWVCTDILSTRRWQK